MIKSRHRFDWEVRLGLLVIIFILLLLNVVSNYIVYKARSSMTDAVLADLTEAAGSISSLVRAESFGQLSQVQTDNLKSRFGLSGVVLIMSRPEGSAPGTKNRWFASIVDQLPPGQIPEMARKLLASDYNSLTRGRNAEYFIVQPVLARSGGLVLILSRTVPELAYLDGTGRFILILSIIFIIMIAVIYLLLYRLILSPFRSIRQQAQDAGREVGADETDVEAVVDEYRGLIVELREKEEQLLKLNEAIRRKADSLEQFNEYLLESMSSGIATVDRDGRILSINRVAAETLQADPLVLVGRYFGDLFGPNWSLIGSIEATLDKNENQPYGEYELLAPNGTRLSLGVAVSAIRDNAGEAIGASVLINDLTAMKRLHQELEKSRRLAALGEMTAGLAHQLRNSLGAILGFGNLVKKRLIKNGIEVDSAVALVEETKEAESLIDRFLNFTKPFDFEPKNENLIATVEELLDNFRVRSDCDRIDFVLRQAVGLNRCELSFDQLLIKQALTNIIENAVIAYRGEHGRVEIEVSRTTDFAIVEVRDFGCGIESEDLERIFTPFFSSRPSGTGLGLPLAGKIVDLHNGRLTVESQPGEGTAFKLMLPSRQPEHVRAEDRQTFPTA